MGDAMCLGWFGRRRFADAGDDTASQGGAVVMATAPQTTNGCVTAQGGDPELRARTRLLTEAARTISESARSNSLTAAAAANLSNAIVWTMGNNNNADGGEDEEGGSTRTTTTMATASTVVVDPKDCVLACQPRPRSVSPSAGKGGCGGAAEDEDDDETAFETDDDLEYDIIACTTNADGTDDSEQKRCCCAPHPHHLQCIYCFPNNAFVKRMIDGFPCVGPDDFGGHIRKGDVFDLEFIDLVPIIGMVRIPELTQTAFEDLDKHTLRCTVQHTLETPAPFHVEESPPVTPRDGPGPRPAPARFAATWVGIAFEEIDRTTGCVIPSMVYTAMIKATECVSDAGGGEGKDEEDGIRRKICGKQHTMAMRRFGKRILIVGVTRVPSAAAAEDPATPAA